MSAKLCLVAWKHHKAMIHGVCRQGGRGIPDKLKQETRTKQDEEFNARDTIISVVCSGDPDMIPIICTSLYDVKPFYMMSTVASEVVWTREFMNIFNNKIRIDLITGCENENGGGVSGCGVWECCSLTRIFFTKNTVKYTI